jgi:hypothetical protein
VAGNGTAELVLPVTPAISLTSVTPNVGSALTVGLLSVSPWGTVRYSTTSSFGLFYAAWYTVVYQAGRSTIPDGLLRGIKNQTAHLWNSQRGAGGRQSAVQDSPGINGAFAPGVLEAINRTSRPVSPDMASAAFPSVIAAIVSVATTAVAPVRVTRGRDTSNDPGDVVMVGVRDSRPTGIRLGRFSRRCRPSAVAARRSAKSTGLVVAWNGQATPTPPVPPRSAIWRASRPLSGLPRPRVDRFRLRRRRVLGRRSSRSRRTTRAPPRRSLSSSPTRSASNEGAPPWPH